MRLPSAAHTSLPWRIHELTSDFELEDVWALPTPGGRADFARLVALMASFDPAQSSTSVRVLFAIRWKLGELLGWDSSSSESGSGSPAPTLRERLPDDLREAPPGPVAEPFSSLYVIENECAAELANRTVHGVLHLGWVADGDGGYRGQMAILVKRNGLLGRAYMAAITPFRHLIVYPMMMRQIEREWRRSGAARDSVQ